MTNKKIGIKKQLPNNFLAERMILNCLIFNSEIIELTVETLPTKAFYFKNHEQIYKAIIFMQKYRLSIDIFSLTTFLQENALLQEIGGITVLIELTNEIPNLLDLEEYIRVVKDKFLRRSLIKFGYKTIQLFQN